MSSNISKDGGALSIQYPLLFGCCGLQGGEDQKVCDSNEAMEKSTCEQPVTDALRVRGTFLKRFLPRNYRQGK